jgi:hypothetical protein
MNMNIMDVSSRLDALAKLGQRLQAPSPKREAVMQKALYYNAWFTLENQQAACSAIAECFLEENRLRSWVSQYHLPEPTTPKTVGMVLAGNLPLVGFHDVLCVFVAGHRAQIKLSEKDAHLLPFLLSELAEIDARSSVYFEWVDRLAGFDAVIATGSNNSARYFEAYFGKYPHIIRKNRNAVAVLHGRESEADLIALGQDVFRYFGLGCRSVSKLYVPQGYDFMPLLETWHAHFAETILHDRYRHNYDYNYALYLINKTPFQMSSCILLTESEAIPSRIAGLNYAFYDTIEGVERELRAKQDEIQCIVAPPSLLSLPVVPFGSAQSPSLSDYPDGVDVLSFLKQIGV